jgi:hypothetical protein
MDEVPNAYWVTLYCDMATERRNSGTNKAAIAEQRRGKQISAAMNKHATI